jgi:hypothetical protein
VQELKGGVQYRDRRFDGDAEAYAHALATSTTVYVGNLAFTTREEQIYEARAPGALMRVLRVLHVLATCRFPPPARGGSFG